MRIQTKLLCGALASSALVAAVAGFGVYGFHRTAAELTATCRTTVLEVEATSRAMEAAAELEDEISALAGRTDRKEASVVEGDVVQVVDRTFQELRHAIAMLKEEADGQLAVMTDAEEIEEEREHLATVQKLTSECDQWEADWATLRNAIVAKGDVKQVDAELIRRSEARADAIFRVAMELQNEAREETAAELTALSEGAVRYEWSSMVAALGAVGLAIGVAVGVARPLARRIARGSERAEAFGRGERSARLEVSRAGDELDQFAATFNTMADRLDQTQERLTASAREAEAANRSKSAFLANMSHEIRTPMTAIMGYSEILLEPDRSGADRQDALQVIRRNAKHLLELISDVLDLSKIEAGKFAVDRVECDLSKLLREVVGLMKPRAAGQGLTFRLEVADGVPRVIVTDPLRLRQILINLLGNAVKFTAAGEVALSVRWRAGERRVEFAVRDSGIGITAQQRERLFRPFSQADESMTRRFGGTGLGLAISRLLAEALGGTIGVESEAGRGSTFTVTVDAGQVPAAVGSLTAAQVGVDESIDEGTRILLKGKVLLAEDGLDNQRLISTHLRNAGATVAIAENGAVAVRLAAAEKFDLVFMDMQMPELDGYSATRELRRMGIATPVVALTAHAMSDDRAKCLEAGCTDYLTKPIEKRTLLRAAAKYLSQGTETAAAGAGPATESLRSQVADDPEMKAILDEFVGGLPGQVDRLAGLLREGDVESLRRCVHQLKGAAGGYGFPQITEQAAVAEQRIRDKDPLAAVAKEVEALIALVKRVERYPAQEPTKAVSHA